MLLALTHAVLAVTAVADKSMTSDEIAHLTAGLAYNQRGDFRLQPENGNLPQRWAALPLALAQTPLPPVSLATWQHADVWRYGHALFYEQGIPTGEYLWAGRCMIALFSAATGLLVFFWSRALFGWRGAFLSLALFVFCPAFLAHGALATSDVVMTFFFLAAVGAWWRHLEQPGAAGAALSAIVLGLAFVAKFSALLLLPMFALIAVIWLAGNCGTDGWRRPVSRLLRSTCVHGLVTWATIWLFYEFRFSAFAPGLELEANFNHGWGWILAGMGAPAPFLFFGQAWHLLPEAWLYGLGFVIDFSKQRGAFLNGEYSVEGWVRFFPYAFLVKTTLPLLLLLGAGLLAALRTGWQRAGTDGVRVVLRRCRPLTPLAALFAVYWVTSLASHLNIGHRHILPTYPVLFIAAGWLGYWLQRRHWLAGGLILVLVGWHTVESLRIRPDYLAYFNQLGGGPANGWRQLVDSSLDWGQELPGLARWLKVNNPGPTPAPVFLAYFGTGDPAYEDIKATALPTLPEVGPDRPWHALTRGVYCLSVTMLQQVYSPVRGAWTLQNEQEYQQLHRTEAAFLAYQNNPRQRIELLHEAPAAQWNSAWRRYEVLRFARLCYYLRIRRPDAMIGYSILIFNLNQSDIDAAVHGSLRELASAIERAVPASSQP